MGAGNVKAAFVHWADLPNGPFRLLVYMALRTRDDEKRPQYWGGREDLAFGLGRRVPPGDDPAARAEREKAWKAVKLATGVLLRAGALRTVERARPGRNAVYELVLTPVRVPENGTRTPVDNPPKPVDNPVDNYPMGPGNRDPNGSRKTGGMGPGFRAEWVPENGEMGPGNRAPKEEEEEVGLSRGGDGRGFPASAPPEQPPAATNDEHGSDHDAASTPTPPRTERPWTYRAACEYLMTLPGAARDTATTTAANELGPDAPRDAVLTRAAAIAHATTGVPA